MRDIEKEKIQNCRIEDRRQVWGLHWSFEAIAVLRMFILRVQRSKFGGKNRNSTKSRKIKEKKEYGTICKQRGYFLSMSFLF